MRILQFLAGLIVTVSCAVALGADPKLPPSLASCADVELLVKNIKSLDVERVGVTASGTWIQARIVDPGVRGGHALVVDPKTIRIVADCWQHAIEASGGAYDLSSQLPGTIFDLFPPTAAVAKALTDLSSSLIPLADEKWYPLSQVQHALALRGLTPRLVDGSRDKDWHAAVAVVAPKVLADVRDQWSQCWRQWSGEIYVAVQYCNNFTGVVNRWVFLELLSEEAEIQRAEAKLASMLASSKDPLLRQEAVLAAFDVDTMGDATIRLAQRAIQDPDSSVRLMVVRLSDAGRLDEDGQPYEKELRKLLQNTERKDPDAAVRSEAKRILALDPYPGVG